jgi:hypothetical protein
VDPAPVQQVDAGVLGISLRPVGAKRRTIGRSVGRRPAAASPINTHQACI